MRSVTKRIARSPPWAVALLLSAQCAVTEEYLSRDEFLALAFDDAQPRVQTLWLTEERRRAAETAVGWVPPALRIRYWQAGERTAWILEKIGKEKPITLGVVVARDHIERIEVLAFRESRGWEIRYPFFTGQFSGVSLEPDGRLSQSIDGITGATLSVRAAGSVARLALWLSAQVRA